ncbi:N-formylglutamate amidohydrolase [Thalassococcus sp. S3]|uniref:N-formylglutamate amidohydrolase n=1 Tax=Thalassococcus sp. S3 TaxID=2017482 RepID=UPI0010244968|nr:N-formylglutamate amidohydrolase [Thalassococcus sp. S3]QBF30391.1 N-formylglutamate amidohydrolase [Thalassococcus sp. S3]
MTELPFFLTGPDRPGRWLVTCDHATNTVPKSVADGDLGLSTADMERHIAYDIGAYGVALELGELLNSPVIAADFSRLVIDPNRGVDDPTLLMKLYDGTIIPANRHADIAERDRRIDAFWRPYHKAMAEQAARPDMVMLAIHSFTPQLNGRSPRPWEVGVLSASDRRLADPLIDILGSHLVSPVGDNEPYAGHLPGDSVDQHALRHGRPNVLIELRNDLIETPEGQVSWARRLAPLLEQALGQSGV